LDLDAHVSLRAIDGAGLHLGDGQEPLHLDPEAGRLAGVLEVLDLPLVLGADAVDDLVAGGEGRALPVRGDDLPGELAQLQRRVLVLAVLDAQEIALAGQGLEVGLAAGQPGGDDLLLLGAAEVDLGEVEDQPAGGVLDEGLHDGLLPG
jgi:hypothetical protein